MNDTVESPNRSGTCQTCGSNIDGKFCSACGEKNFDPRRDLSVIKFIEHGIDIFIHFDGKFFKTFMKLFFSPGELSSNYVSGKRVQYMKPFQLFFFAGVLFYFLLPSVNAYYLTADQFDGVFGAENLTHYNSADKIIEKTTKYGVSKERVIEAATRETIHSSKIFLFTIVPVWAVVLFILFHTSNGFYVSHLVFSLHCFTFFIITHMLYLYTLTWFMNSEPLLYFVPLFLIFAVYIFIAIRNFYHTGIIATFIKSLITCMSFLILLELYRENIAILNLFLL
jgi:hypothetical protein